jgi:hypothetical protein
MIRRYVFISFLTTVLLFQLSSFCVNSQTAATPSSLAPSSTAAAGQTVHKAEPVSKMKLYLLSAVASLSPGIALLKVVHDYKDDKTLNGGNNWLGSFLWLFWIIAFLGFTLDKFPVVASVHHFFEYGVIWFLAYVAATFLNADFSTINGLITGGAVQAMRQGVRAASDGVSVGFASPVISTIEDGITYAAVSWLL